MDRNLIDSNRAFNRQASVLYLASLICLIERCGAACVEDVFCRACIDFRIAIISVSPKPARTRIDDYFKRLPLRAIVYQSGKDGLLKRHVRIEWDTLSDLGKHASFFHLTGGYRWYSSHVKRHINHLSSCRTNQNRS